MKYIVFWMVYKSIEVPCPDQWSYDIQWGKGWSCLVGHMRMIPLGHSARFHDYKSAKVFYDTKVKEHEKNMVNVWSQTNSKRKPSVRKQFFAFNGAVDSVRIDSIDMRKK